MEPKAQGDRFDSVLRGLDNVILTPHVGGSTEEAQTDIGDFVAGKLLDYLRSGTTALSVNLPGVRLPRLEGTCRVLLLHRNQPGAMAHFNSALADHGLNVEQQALSTAGTMGFAVTDVRGALTGDVVAQLRDLPETVRVDLMSS